MQNQQSTQSYESYFGEIVLIEVLDIALIIKLRKNIGEVFFSPFKLIDSPDSALIIHADDAVFCAAVSGNAAPGSAP